jgi:agmatine deiminase
LVIQDWGFNGWGGDYNFSKCNAIPTKIATATGITALNLNNVMTVEGGAYEMDGHGVFLATKSAILSQSNPNAQIFSIRNLGMTVAQANAIFTQYLGASKFYWLEGAFSTDDITDFHIDGFAKFAPDNQLVTMSQADLLYWGVTQADINMLFGMTNTNNVAYTKVYLPLTQNNVFKTDGTDLGYKGSYANYYVANNRVLVPNYNDPNDAPANAIIAGLYPGRTVVGIDVRNLYGNGGMVHCVTQQQPAATIVSTHKATNGTATHFNIYPNPAQNNTNIVLNLEENTALKIEIYTLTGMKIAEISSKNYAAGENIIPINTDNWTNGLYICQIMSDKTTFESQKFIINK